MLQIRRRAAEFPVVVPGLCRVEYIRIGDRQEGSALSSAEDGAGRSTFRSEEAFREICIAHETPER